MLQETSGMCSQKLEQEEKGLLIFPQELPLEETLTQGPSASAACPLLSPLLGLGSTQQAAGGGGCPH